MSSSHAGAPGETPGPPTPPPVHAATHRAAADAAWAHHHALTAPIAAIAADPAATAAHHALTTGIAATHAPEFCAALSTARLAAGAENARHDARHFDALADTLTAARGDITATCGTCALGCTARLHGTGYGHGCARCGCEAYTHPITGERATHHSPVRTHPEVPGTAIPAQRDLGGA